MCNFKNKFLSSWGKRLSFAFLTVASLNVNAAPRADVDLDDDGLIEIFTLSDLDSIRNHLDGSAFSDGGDNVANNIGCLGDDTGATNCTGYELMNDLDFDTDGSGDFSAGDQFYNGGLGWLRIGDWFGGQYYTATFDGNYFTIHNLYIDRASESSKFDGLFSNIYGASAAFRNISFTNVYVNSGYVGSGGLGLGVNGARAERVSVEGTVMSSAWAGCTVGALEASTPAGYELFGDCDVTANYAGGVVGSFYDGRLENSYSWSRVNGSINAGGLIGRVYGAGGNIITNSYAAGLVSGASSAGGISGDSLAGTITSVYWDLDATGQATADSTGGVITGTTGLTTADMQSPTVPNTVVTGGIIAYENWDEIVWNFRTDTQYPVLRWMVADADGDGILDSVEDANGNGIVDPGETDPNNPDTDGDGISDGVEDANQNGIFDVGETNPLSMDTDGDTLLDGVEDANQNGVVDPGETDPRLADTDGDGIDDATEGTGDADGDGIIDPLDPDPVCGNDCGVHTSTGGGSSDLVLLGLLGLLLMRRFSKLGLAVVLSFGLAATGIAEEGDLTFGASFGHSSLSPEAGTNTQYELVDKTDNTYKVSLSYQFANRWGVDLSHSDLGSVAVESILFGSGVVDYKATALSGFYTGDLGSDMDYFIKVGASDISNTSVGVDYFQDKDTNVYFGLGLAFKLSDSFDMRVEYDSYSEDAEAVSVGLFYRF